MSMWWAAVLALLVLELKPLLDAQLTSPNEPACPGNRIIFVCHHTGLLSRWTITLPSTMQRLENNTLMRPIGSIVTFENDPSFHFELHIVSIGPNSITSELQVMAVRGLNGVTVKCREAQQSDPFMFTISSALIGE